MRPRHRRESAMGSLELVPMWAEGRCAIARSAAVGSSAVVTAAAVAAPMVTTSPAAVEPASATAYGLTGKKQCD
jgi:hypothetical protein